MTDDPQLHHSARRIVPGSLENVIDMFRLLECKVFYLQAEQRWAMIGQNKNFLLQIQEIDDTPIQSKTRLQSHIAFISNHPKEQIDKVESWAKHKNLLFKRGGWNEKELWFDLPEVFIDFVVEVMHKSVVEE